LLASGVMSDRLLGIGAAAIGMVFLAITAVLLIWDLKRPERFWYLLVKPNTRSWLVWGGYILLVVGGLAFFWAVASLAGWQGIERVLAWLALPGGIAAAGYTAFLFGQAGGAISGRARSYFPSCSCKRWWPVRLLSSCCWSRAEHSRGERGSAWCWVVG